MENFDCFDCVVQGHLLVNEGVMTNLAILENCFGLNLSSIGHVPTQFEKPLAKHPILHFHFIAVSITHHC